MNIFMHTLGLTNRDWNQPDLSRIEPHLSNYSANMYTHYAEYAQNINIDQSLGIWILIYKYMYIYVCIYI
jgi:hypothetical protein